MVSTHEVGEHPVGRTSAAAQLAGVMWLHLSRCVKMFKFQSANIRFTNNTTFKRNVKIIVRYMDLRVIFGNQFLDVGETNNWVLQLKNLLMQSDWNLKVGMRISQSVKALEKKFLKEKFLTKSGFLERKPSLLGHSL